MLRSALFNQPETTMNATLKTQFLTANAPNLPSKTGEPSGKGRGNNPPKGK